MTEKEGRGVRGDAVHRCIHHRCTDRNPTLNHEDRDNGGDDLKLDRWSNVTLRQRRIARAVLV